MGALQNIFFVTFLSLFIACVHNEPIPTTIREMKSSNNVVAVNSTNNASFGITPQKVVSNSGKSVQNITSNNAGPLLPKIGAHSGREHEIETVPKDIGLNKGVNNSSLVPTKSDDIKPVYDMQPLFNVEFPQQHDPDKSSVPKKGVGLPDMDPPPNITASTVDNKSIEDKKSTTINGANALTNNSSINVTVFHKPIVTEPDDHADATAKQTVINIDQIDPLLANKESNRSDYIVPIVAVILSVPLVAILISIVYKRSADWWQHRNYKRMDFLIEGIYHN